MNRQTSRFHIPSGNDALKKALKNRHPYDIALIYLDQGEAIKERMITVLEPNMLSGLFIEFSFENQTDLLNRLDDQRQKALIEHLPTDELKQYLDLLDDDDVQEILAKMSPMKAKIMSLLMRYQDDTAASMMSADFMTVPVTMSIKDATQSIIRRSKDSDYLDKVFVVDTDETLCGAISLVQLITARPSQSLDEIKEPVQHVIPLNMSIEETIRTVVDYDQSVVPVMDQKGRLIGIITADDIFDEIIEETESDYQGIALIKDHDNQLSAWMRSRRRLPWLMIAVFLNVMIALFLSVFEATVLEVAALILFQPMILGMAGNIGTQALAVTILGLHHDEIDRHQLIGKHLTRETLVGLLNSLIMAMLAFVYVYLFMTFSPLGNQAPFGLAAVVFSAVFVSMSVSAMIGVLIPLILDHFEIDPANASGPIMTTLNDLIALMVYFGIATLAFL
jgi:magnesium transporter